jgi:hypothetical protein
LAPVMFRSFAPVMFWPEVFGYGSLSTMPAYPIVAPQTGFHAPIGLFAPTPTPAFALSPVKRRVRGQDNSRDGLARRVKVLDTWDLGTTKALYPVTTGFARLAADTDLARIIDAGVRRVGPAS